MLDAYEREAMILDAIEEQLAKLREKYRKRARVVKCAECERYFVAFRHEAKYCSVQCRQIAHLAKKRQMSSSTQESVESAETRESVEVS
jgi:endogenous inhibitor of DNA gyrase (YacG/DUF329 family)